MPFYAISPGDKRDAPVTPVGAVTQGQLTHHQHAFCSSNGLFALKTQYAFALCSESVVQNPLG